MWFTAGFGAACAIGAYFYVSWLLFAALICIALTVVFAVGMGFVRVLRFFTAVFLGLSLGFFWFSLYDRGYLSAAREADGQTPNTVITVRDYSYETSRGCGFDGEVTLDGHTYRVRAYLNAYEELQPGDSVSGSFSFRLTTGGASEGPTYHQGKGIFLIAYQDAEYEIDAVTSIQLADYPAIWRQKLIQIISSAFSEDTSAFAKALLLGDRSEIDYETNTAFKISGISHIIAVSGLHVSILFGLVYLLSGRRRLLSAMLGIPVIIVFMAITGFSPSVVRAGIMQILVLIATLFDRDYDQLTSLSFAALVMLAVNPLVITSVSFQLSVCCMLGIFMFSEPIRKWLLDKMRLGTWEGKWTKWLSGSISITLSAMVFTTPLVAVYFGAVSLVGLLTNLLVLWVVSFLFYGIMLICAVGLVSGTVSAAIGWLLAWPIRYILFVAKTLSRLPLAAVYTKSDYIVMWLVFCYGLLAVYLCLKKKPVMAYCFAAVTGLCLALALSWAEPLLNECRVTALDVGQGQCILLQSEDKTFIVDCGGSYDEDAADMASETLLSQGIGRVDGIILTHYDKDHVGGVPGLLSRIGTDALFLPFAEDDEAIADVLSQKFPDGSVLVKDDLLLTYGDTKITVFAPLSYKSGNESSMCVLFQTENCDILITGDRDEKTEQILLQRYDIPKLEVLIAGHHGASTSTGDALLAATRPEYVLISVGENNPYGHPAHQLLERLSKYNCKVLRTDRYGTIVFRR